MWLILTLPALATLLVVLLDVSNVWLAKTELKNALDAASLSAVKTWGEGGSTLNSRLAANDASSTNTVLGTTIPLSAVEGACTNNNVSSTDELVLGTINDTGLVLEFNCNTAPNCGAGIPFAVKARKTIQVSSVASSLFSFVIGPYDVTAESYARFACPSGPPQLVRVESVVCVCP
jgi:Flp pilus assembly protein TadG